MDAHEFRIGIPRMVVRVPAGPCAGWPDVRFIGGLDSFHTDAIRQAQVRHLPATWSFRKAYL